MFDEIPLGKQIGDLEQKGEEDDICYLEQGNVSLPLFIHFLDENIPRQLAFLRQFTDCSCPSPGPITFDKRPKIIYRDRLVN